ncbi:NUMOD3 domain-containing DNA-binding protein [Microbacterium sp. CFBP9023]|uniref:NUMOD3 domain-containing DNA-binding protein n=1 Tax=Microbacterium sp. CFBP9023 TaxID=3096535 RepID=UPI002A69D384|nr:NUMOD3 domain-containing DNA-binding protein [Microbacterium sp. CFBP9023]MDY0985120.1 NUMOD3 domain-containing DNA-binding protein [Microbacterium sp. CFBP9023]
MIMLELRDRVGGWPIIGLVYAVRRYDSPEYRYVGMTTKSVGVRSRQHLKSARAGKRTPFYDWIRARDSEQEEVYFEPVEIVMGSQLEALGLAEQSWIAKLRAEGHRLLNLSDGGLGPQGHVWTEAQREAAGQRSRGRKRPDIGSGPDHPSWGTRRSDEQRASWSAQRKGMNAGERNPNFAKFGPEHPKFGHRMSEQAKARLSEMRKGELNPNFGKSASVETRLKMSMTRAGKPMPSSRRSAHTRYHSNKGVFKDTCACCVDDRQNAQDEMRKE